MRTCWVRVLIGYTLLFFSACTKHLEFPPMGDPLASSAKLEISTSLKELTLRYSDSCAQLQELPLGERLHEALQEGLHRTFKTVLSDGREHAAAPDHIVQVELIDSSFDLNKEALYDRAPASLHLNAIARIYDGKGTLLRQTDIKIARRERLRLEQLAKNCNYIIEPFIHDAITDFASRVALNARFAASGQEASSPTAPNLESSSTLPAPTVSASQAKPLQETSRLPSSTLRFKAMLLDENSDLIFEGGEHVRVRVDVINTGTTAIEKASASLTGTQAAIEWFPTTALRIPPLLPGETKSLEFVATLPLLAQPLHAEIQVEVTENSGSTTTPQTLSFTIASTGAGTDDIDQLPAQTSGPQRPELYVVSIGLSAHLDRHLPPRKYASRDAEMVAKYFQTFGGAPSSNIQLLSDWKAFRSHIHKAFLEWLPSHPTNEAIVIVYFSGQVTVSQTGDVMLVPYDGTSAPSTLYSLKTLEGALARLKPQQILLIVDGKGSHPQGASKTRTLPRWELSSSNTIRLIASEGLVDGLDDDNHRHGLFTYYLLRGLRGEADTNRDGKVTLWEITGYVQQKVAWAAKSKFASSQRPQVLPDLKPGDQISNLVLTTLPSLAGTETP